MVNSTWTTQSKILNATVLQNQGYSDIRETLYCEYRSGTFLIHEVPYLAARGDIKFPTDALHIQLEFSCQSKVRCQHLRERERMETETYYSAFKCGRWGARYKSLKITTLAYFDGCRPNARSAGNWSVVNCLATNIVHSYGCCKEPMTFILKS